MENNRDLLKGVFRALTNERALSLIIAFNLGFAQPTLDLLGRNAEFFVAHDSSPPQIVGVVLLLSVGIPLLLALVVGVGRAVLPGVGNAIHLGLLSILSAATVLHLLSRTLAEAPGPLLVMPSVLAGAGVAYLFARNASFRFLMRFGAVVPVALIVWFVLISPAGRLLNSGASSVVPVSAKEASPIVMIIFDELPLTTLMDGKGYIDQDMFPNFARLARSSTWFRNTTTVANLTPKAVPALLTGRYAPDGRLPTYRDHPENVFTLLRGSYRLIAAEPITQLCPPRACRSVGMGSSSLWSDIALVTAHAILPADMTKGLPPVDEGWSGFAAHEEDPIENERAQQFADFVSAIRAHDRSSLYLGHFLLPHLPWNFLPSGQTYPADPQIPGVKRTKRFGRGWTDDAWLVKQGYQRHLLQTRFTDRLIGDLLDHLAKTGLYDDTIIVVTSDHGAAFRPGAPRRTFTRDGRPETLHVPLFIKRAGQSKGAINDARIETVDILPTIMELVGASTSGFDGRPAFDVASDEERPRRMMAGGRTRWLESDWPAARRVARDKYRKLGIGTSPLTLWRIAPTGTSGLIGRTIDAEVPTSNYATAALHNAIAYENVNPSGRSLPALLSGQVKFWREPRGQARVAVAVNGKIAAVTKSYGNGSTREFYAMVSPVHFVRGSNDIRLFTIGRDNQSINELSTD